MIYEFVKFGGGGATAPKRRWSKGGSRGQDDECIVVGQIRAAYPAPFTRENDLEIPTFDRGIKAPRKPEFWSKLIGVVGG